MTYCRATEMKFHKCEIENARPRRGGDGSYVAADFKLKLFILYIYVKAAMEHSCCKVNSEGYMVYLFAQFKS